MKLEEVKKKYEELSKSIKSNGIESDLIYKFLIKDHTAKIDYIDFFKIEVNNNLISVGKDSRTYDIIYLTWLNHLVGYWEDKTALLNLYLNSEIKLSPMDAYRKLNELVVKIEKRLLILNYYGHDNNVSITEQTVTKNDAKTVYKLVRGYWYSKDNVKVRSINFHLKSLDKFKKINEIFKNNGSPVYKEFDFIEKKEFYYIVFNDYKVFIDMNITNEDFYKLIIFDIQTSKFKDEY